jgi:hypothetical protein
MQISALVKRVRLELGVPAECRVFAQLDKLVLYGPGDSSTIDHKSSKTGPTLCVAFESQALCTFVLSLLAHVVRSLWHSADSAAE